MSIVYHKEMIQGSEAWHSIRCGLPTASEMKLLVTPTLKVAANEKERAHMWELLAQRLTKHVEPRYISDDMLRGQEDEIEAVALYAKTYEPVERVGFVTNDRWGSRSATRRTRWLAMTVWSSASHGARNTRSRPSLTTFPQTRLIRIL